MPIRKPQTHTLKSVELVAAKLDALSASIRVSKTLMEEEPPMGEVAVEWQNSLEVGLVRLQSWVDALRDAVDQKRMKLAVSDSNGTPEKARKKK